MGCLTHHNNKGERNMTQSKEKIKIFNLNSEIEDLKKKIEFLYFKLDTKDKVIQSLEAKYKEYLGNKKVA